MLVTARREITKKQYIDLQSYSFKEINDFVLSEAEKSMLNPCAYGFYNPGVIKKDGKYFVTWDHYDSCD